MIEERWLFLDAFELRPFVDRVLEMSKAVISEMATEQGQQSFKFELSCDHTTFFQQCNEKTLYVESLNNNLPDASILFVSFLTTLTC